MRQSPEYLGVHTEYIVDLLEMCKEWRNSSYLYSHSLMKLKKTLLRMLRWCKKTGLLEVSREGYFTLYKTSQKGREFLSILREYK